MASCLRIVTIQLIKGADLPCKLRLTQTLSCSCINILSSLCWCGILETMHAPFSTIRTYLSAHTDPPCNNRHSNNPLYLVSNRTHNSHSLRLPHNLQTPLQGTARPLPPLFQQQRSIPNQLKSQQPSRAPSSASHGPSRPEEHGMARV